MEEVEEVEGEAGEAGTLGVTSRKYIVISVRHFCVFISLKRFLYSTNSFSTICFSFSACTIERSTS